MAGLLWDDVLYRPLLEGFAVEIPTQGTPTATQGTPTAPQVDDNELPRKLEGRKCRRQQFWSGVPGLLAFARPGLSACLVALSIVEVIAVSHVGTVAGGFYKALVDSDAQLFRAALARCALLYMLSATIHGAQLWVEELLALHWRSSLVTHAHSLYLAAGGLCCHLITKGGSSHDDQWGGQADSDGLCHIPAGGPAGSHEYAKGGAESRLCSGGEVDTRPHAGGDADSCTRMGGKAGSHTHGKGLGGADCSGMRNNDTDVGGAAVRDRDCVGMPRSHDDTGMGIHPESGMGMHHDPRLSLHSESSTRVGTGARNRNIGRRASVGRMFSVGQLFPRVPRGGVSSRFRRFLLGGDASGYSSPRVTATGLPVFARTGGGVAVVPGGVRGMGEDPLLAPLFDNPGGRHPFRDDDDNDDDEKEDSDGVSLLSGDKARGKGPSGLPEAATPDRSSDLLDNPDLRITGDIAAFTTSASQFLRKAASTPFLIAYYSLLVHTHLGWLGVLPAYGFFLLGVAINLKLVVPLARLVARQERLEGDLRFLHTRVRLLSEDIAMQRGGEAERALLTASLRDVLDNQWRLARRHAVLEWVTNMFDYMGAAVNYILIGLSLFLGGKLAIHASGSSGDAAQLISNISFATLQLVYSFTSLIDLSRLGSDIAGFGGRVALLLRRLEAVQPPGSGTPEPHACSMPPGSGGWAMLPATGGSVAQASTMLPVNTAGADASRIPSLAVGRSGHAVASINHNRNHDEPKREDSPVSCGGITAECCGALPPARALPHASVLWGKLRCLFSGRALFDSRAGIISNRSPSTVDGTGACGARSSYHLDAIPTEPGTTGCLDISPRGTGGMSSMVATTPRWFVATGGCIRGYLPGTPGGRPGARTVIMNAADGYLEGDIDYASGHPLPLHATSSNDNSIHNKSHLDHSDGDIFHPDHQSAGGSSSFDAQPRSPLLDRPPLKDILAPPPREIFFSVLHPLPDGALAALQRVFPHVVDALLREEEDRRQREEEERRDMEEEERREKEEEERGWNVPELEDMRCQKEGGRRERGLDEGRSQEGGKAVNDGVEGGAPNEERERQEEGGWQPVAGARSSEKGKSAMMTEATAAPTVATAASAVGSTASAATAAARSAGAAAAAGPEAKTKGASSRKDVFDIAAPEPHAGRGLAPAAGGAEACAGRVAAPASCADSRIAALRRHVVALPTHQLPLATSLVRARPVDPVTATQADTPTQPMDSLAEQMDDALAVFVMWSRAVKAFLHERGHWAEAIDPCSGYPLGDGRGCPVAEKGATDGGGAEGGLVKGGCATGSVAAGRTQQMGRGRDGGEQAAGRARKGRGPVSSIRAEQPSEGKGKEGAAGRGASSGNGDDESASGSSHVTRQGACLDVRPVGVSPADKDEEGAGSVRSLHRRISKDGLGSADALGDGGSGLNSRGAPATPPSAASIIALATASTRSSLAHSSSSSNSSSSSSASIGGKRSMSANAMLVTRGGGGIPSNRSPGCVVQGSGCYSGGSISTTNNDGIRATSNSSISVPDCAGGSRSSHGSIRSRPSAGSSGGDSSSGVEGSTQPRRRYSEVDGAELLLGFSTLDQGPCKLALHPVTGASVYPASLFTTAPPEVAAAAAAAARELLAPAVRCIQYFPPVPLTSSVPYYATAPQGVGVRSRSKGADASAPLSASPPATMPRRSTVSSSPLASVPLASAPFASTPRGSSPGETESVRCPCEGAWPLSVLSRTFHSSADARVIMEPHEGTFSSSSTLSLGGTSHGGGYPALALEFAVRGCTSAATPGAAPRVSRTVDDPAGILGTGISGHSPRGGASSHTDGCGRPRQVWAGGAETSVDASQHVVRMSGHHQHGLGSDHPSSAPLDHGGGFPRSCRHHRHRHHGGAASGCAVTNRRIRAEPAREGYSQEHAHSDRSWHGWNWRALPVATAAGCRQNQGQEGGCHSRGDDRGSVPAGPRLILDNVTCATPAGCLIVSGLSVVVEAGRGLLVVGPSGGGKSTLLQALAGIYPLQTGAVLLEPWASAHVAGHGLGELPLFLTQRPLIAPLGLAGQLVYPRAIDSGHAGLSHYGHSGSGHCCHAGSCHCGPFGSSHDGHSGSGPSGCDLYGELAQILDEVGLLYLLERAGFDWEVPLDWSRQLSQGEQQRLALARLLFHRPWLAVCDEATSALDTEQEEKMYMAMMRRGISWISVSHRRESLERWHSQVLTLSGDGSGTWTLRDIQRA
eukprot:jgi/Mesvir1/27507/Mv07273-RA.1